MQLCDFAQLSFHLQDDSNKSHAFFQPAQTPQSGYAPNSDSVEPPKPVRCQSGTQIINKLDLYCTITQLCSYHTMSQYRHSFWKTSKQ